MGFEFQRPGSNIGFLSHHCWPSESYFPSLRLQFLFCNTTIIISSSHSLVGIKWDDVHEVLLHYRNSVHLVFHTLFLSYLPPISLCPPHSFISAQMCLALYWGWPAGLSEREGRSQGKRRVHQLYEESFPSGVNILQAGERNPWGRGQIETAVHWAGLHWEKTFPFKCFCIFKAQHWRRPNDIPSAERGWDICFNLTTHVKRALMTWEWLYGQWLPSWSWAISNLCNAHRTDYFISNFSLCGLPLVPREVGKAIFEVGKITICGVTLGSGCL